MKQYGPKELANDIQALVRGQCEQDEDLMEIKALLARIETTIDSVLIWLKRTANTPRRKR